MGGKSERQTHRRHARCPSEQPHRAAASAAQLRPAAGACRPLRGAGKEPARRRRRPHRPATGERHRSPAYTRGVKRSACESPEQRFPALPECRHHCQERRPRDGGRHAEREAQGHCCAPDDLPRASQGNQAAVRYHDRRMARGRPRRARGHAMARQRSGFDICLARDRGCFGKGGNGYSKRPVEFQGAAPPVTRRGTLPQLLSRRLQRQPGAGREAEDDQGNAAPCHAAPDFLSLRLSGRQSMPGWRPAGD